MTSFASQAPSATLAAEAQIASLAEAGASETVIAAAETVILGSAATVGAPVAAAGSEAGYIAVLAVADVAILGLFYYEEYQLYKELFPPTVTGPETQTEQVKPTDPNFISGPAGAGPEQYVSTAASMPYYIAFENEASADAPAQVVKVTQQLDSSLDWSTFQLGGFGFGGQYYSVPGGRTNYHTVIDDRTSTGVYVDVLAQFDSLTGIVTWTFTSLDPTTNDIPVGDPEEGFLPPDVTAPKGEGWVTYFVSPKTADSTGTLITAQATVYFNAGLSDESSLATAPFVNTIDSGAPTSGVAALPAASPATFTVSWAGSDDGSGVAEYNEYVSDDGGAYSLWQTATTDTSDVFTGQDGHTYRFYSVSVDAAGNAELPPAGFQAVTTVDDVPPTSSAAALPAFSLSNFTVSWSGTDVGSGIAGYDVFVSDDGAPYALWLSGTTLTSATFTGQDGHTYGFYTVATDAATNVQPTPSAAQATTTVDNAPPTSTVAPLPATITGTNSVTVTWSGTDAGSGVASYTIFVSVDGGAFALWLTDTTQTSSVYSAATGHTYGFYSVATDRVGLVQPTPTAPQAVTTILPPPISPLPPISPPPISLPPISPLPPTAANPNLVGYPQFAVGGETSEPSTVTLYNQDGSVEQTITPFPGATGGVRVAVGDFNGDGIPDLAAATGPGTVAEVKVIDGKTGATLFDLQPFAGFTGGAFVAAGDITGDGLADLVVTPDLGGGPRVSIYRGGDFAKIADFFGIDDPNFRGGARAALGDLTGDGHADLAISAGIGGGPRISLFDGAALAAGKQVHLTPDFFAFDPSLRNGTYIAIGDINGDGLGDLIFGAGSGGGPRVLVVSGEALLANGPDASIAVPLASFYAGDPADRGGIRVAVKNLDDDVYADVVTGSGTGGGSAVAAYLGKDLATGNDTKVLGFDNFSGLTGGVFVG